MKKVAIVQSSYIPWKGYFDIINSVEEFILLDSVQYTKRDWRSRNRVKGPNGLQWLSVPVAVKGKYSQAIDEVQVLDQSWRRKHWNTLAHCYGKAPYFKQYAPAFKALYLEGVEPSLSRINQGFIQLINEMLGIGTVISRDRDYQLYEGSTQRLVELCRQAGGSTYLSGPSAGSYLDALCFEQAGIELAWVDYSDYPEYHQPFPPFEHGVSIVDLLFNEGPDASNYLKSF